MANGKTGKERMSAALRKQLGYLSDTEVAALLGVGVPRLHNRRSAGDAPVSSKVGTQHLTKLEDLHAYIARRRGARATA